MTWFGWALIVFQVLGMFCQAAVVGKVREPMSPESFAVALLVSLGLLFGVLTVGTGNGL